MRGFLFVGLLIGFITNLEVVAYGQDQPPKEALAAEIVQLVPPYWSVTDVNITASVNLGDPVEPNLKQRFEAIVSPRAELFLTDAASEGAYGPFVPVLPSLAADTLRTLYGVATATYAAGQWTIGITLENDVAQLGMPLDMYGGPTVVRGSEQEAALRERLRADVAERMRHQIAAEEERVKGEQAKALTTLNAAHRKEISNVESEHAVAMSALRARVAAEEQLISVDLDRLKANHAADLENAKERQEQERQQLARDQEKSLSDSRLSHAEEMKRLKLQFSQAIEKARSELQSTTDLIALEGERQEALATLLEAQRETAQRDAELLEQQRQAEIAAREREAQVAENQRQHEEDLRQAARAEQAQRLSTLEVALRGEDQNAAIVAFQDAMASGNDTLQAIAVREAFSGESEVMKELALQNYLSSRNEINFLYNGNQANGQTISGTFSIEIMEKSKENNVLMFKGLFRGGAFPEKKFGNDIISGTLKGLTLSGASENCSFSAKLSRDSRLEGTMDCQNVRTRGGYVQTAFGIAGNVH